MLSCVIENQCNECNTRNVSICMWYLSMHTGTKERLTVRILTPGGWRSRRSPGVWLGANRKPSRLGGGIRIHFKKAASLSHKPVPAPPHCATCKDVTNSAYQCRDTLKYHGKQTNQEADLNVLRKTVQMLETNNLMTSSRVTAVSFPSVGTKYFTWRIV